MKYGLVVRKDTLSIWGYLLLLIPHIFPVGVQHLCDLNSFVYHTTILSSLVIIAIYVVNVAKGRRKANPMVVLATAFSLYLVAITAIKGGAVYRSITYAMFFLSEILWADLFVYRFKIRGIKSLMHLTMLYAIINTVFLLISPEFFGAELSYRRYCFISNDNSLLPFLLPSMVISLIYYELVGKKDNLIKVILIFLVYSLSVYITWSGTGVILFTLFILLVLLRRTKIGKILTAKKAVFISVASVFLFVNFSVQDNFSKLFSLIDKDVTFSGRIAIWAMGIEAIKKSWLFGGGMAESDLLFSIGSSRDFTSHNQFIQFIIWGGGILLLLYVLMIFVAYKGINKGENPVSERIKMYSNLGLFCMLYYYVFETHNSMPMVLILLVNVYYLDVLIRNKSYEMH